MSNSENTSTVSTSINASENISNDLELPLEKQYSIDRQSQIGFDPERLIPTKTYVEVGIEKLTALCDSLGMNAKLGEIVEIFRAMTISWRDRQIGESIEWPSDVSDDGSPFEFSIALDPDKVELRVLVEAQGTNPNLQSNWQAGLELNQYLAAHYHVSLDRFAQIADLFVPTNADAKFSMWHSACFYPDKPSAFKLYLNPQSQHKSRSAAVVEESLVRLGFTHAWPTLAETAAQRGPDKDEFVYFSLDLAAHHHARVKVYLRHHDATPAELESALSAARNYVPGDAIEFCQAMAPAQTSFSAKPAISAFSWVESDNATPSSSTLHIPISNYAIDDRSVCDRLDLYFIEHNIPISEYQSALKAFTKRSLETGVGMHSYTSLRREQQQRRVALYLNPEINVIRPSGKIVDKEATQSLPSLEEIAWHYEEYTLAHHPFLQRLEREPVNPQQIWILLINLQEAVNNFTRRLASIVARTDDERIRCILAKQLNDELGNGNINGIHRKLFDKLMIAIKTWQVDDFTTEMVIPGQEFSQRMEDIYVKADPYVGVGAAILMEIFGKQFDLWLGRELRKTTVDRSAISWVILHEELEIDHADESIVIARFVADAQEEAEARKGVEMACMASWHFLDRLYRLCYCELPSTI
jgi:pyrroloquinoline quinone (PQQ) biosynthesis protein C